MKNVDYIIVGGGYAGLFFAHQLLKNNKTFVLFSDGKKGASRISAGMVNPVVLKKFTTFWLAQQQIDFLQQIFLEIEQYLGKNYLLKKTVHPIFHDENEKTLWLKKAADDSLSPFLNTQFSFFSDILNPFGTGEVLQSARLDVELFFKNFFEYLEEKRYLINNRFIHKKVKPQQSVYDDIHYKHIVFCEGMAVKQNPYFADIPVNANKGHHLSVKLSQKLSEDFTFKKKHFLFPLKNNLYYYGGTYDRNQFDEKIDESAVEQLKSGLSEFYSGTFDVADIHFGFRPTVKDRRPILGTHSEFENLYVFNGLGARGVLNGNYFSRELFEHIEYGKPLLAEVDLKRFK